MDVIVPNKDNRPEGAPIPRSEWRGSLDQVSGIDFKDIKLTKYDGQICSDCGGKGVHEKSIRLSKTRIVICHCQKG